MEGSAVIRKTMLYAAMLILVLGACSLAGCGNNDDNATAGNEVQAGTAPAKFGKGSPAPDFTLQRLDGGDLQLSSLRGKAVILDFWDTWCPPCRKAMPHLQELSEQYADDLVVVGVALGREGEAKVRKFTQDYGLTFEMVMLGKNRQLISDYGGIQSIPTTFLIDEDGIIQDIWVGGFGKAVYEKAVQTVIGS
jgi:peroxiredoxin